MSWVIILMNRMNARYEESVGKRCEKWIRWIIRR